MKFPTPTKFSRILSLLLVLSLLLTVFASAAKSETTLSDPREILSQLDYDAVVEEGVFRENYTSVAEAVEAVGADGELAVLKPESINAEALLALMDYDAAVEDVKYLSQAIGPRPAGTASERTALDYVASEFDELGYEVRRQDVPIGNRSLGDIYLDDLILAAGVPSANSYYTAPEKATGTAVYLADPTDTASLGEDLSGKIVFFPGDWGSGKDPDTYTAIAALDAANAEGIVVMMEAPYSSYHTNLPSMNFQSAKMYISTPVFYTAAMEATRIPAYLAEHEGAEVTMERRTATQSQNVIGIKKAAVETDMTIYVTAHIDSVAPSPGANDNGSGVAGVLTLARAFKDVKTNYNIQFLAFGAEEIGLVGSTYFTKNLTAEDIANAIGTYNMDMIATGVEECAYLCIDTYTKGNVSTNGLAAASHVGRNSWNAAETLGFDMDYCYVEYVGGSDHVPFNSIGIPAVTFIWEVSQSSHNLEPYYHTSRDTMEYNFSREKLETTLDVVALAVYNDATADYAAVVGEGVKRAYYNTLEDAYAAAEENETVMQLKPAEDPNLKLGHTLDLASDISVNFAVSKTDLEGYDMDTVYMESTLDVYDGDGKTVSTTLTLSPVENGDYYYFTLTGLTAVQVNDRITSYLRGTKNGLSYVSPVDDYSIADYAYSQMNKANMPESLKTLCADLLRYGAKAQIFKSYRTDNLADSAMTDEQMAFLSDIDAVTFENINTVLNDLNSATVTWAGKALDLASKVTLKFIFNPANYQGNPEELNLRLTFSGINGETKTEILTGAELYNAEYGFYVFSFDRLLAAELRTVVSAQIFEGETPVSHTLQYSAETYGVNKTGALGDLCKALFAYSDSAKVYFGTIA